MKPIEPGCLCVIVSSSDVRYIGKECTAVKFSIYEKFSDGFYPDVWLVDIEKMPDDEGDDLWFDQCNLRRIDDYEPTAGDIEVYKELTCTN